MANIRKSFNLRNGVQVDDDNFIVNQNGLVGIGTSIPQAFLDVRSVQDTDAVKIVGHTTVTTFYSGIATVGILSITQSLKVSGPAYASTFYGSAAGLTSIYAIAVDGWYVDSGNSSISTIFKVGIGTTNPQYSLQIGDPDSTEGISFNAITGDIVSTGGIAATSFSGDLDAGYLTGTISNDRLPVLENSKIPNNFQVTGIITALGTFKGNLVGIATTAIDLIPNARVSIDHIASNTSDIGVSTVSTRLRSAAIGVGTNSPYSAIHVVGSSSTSLHVTAATESTITLGRSLSPTGNTGGLKFGNTSGSYLYSTTKTLDIVNYDTGNLNYYLHYGASGIGTGNFNWIYAPDSSNPLMTLTYGGRLGIGITNPSNTLEVIGSFRATNNSTFGGNITLTTGNLILSSGSINGNVTGNVTGNLTGNVNALTGISTFNDLESSLTNTGQLLIGTNSSNYLIQTSTGNDTFFVSGDGSVGIGTTQSIDASLIFSVVGESGFMGDLNVGENQSQGLVLTSPNGTRYRLIVSNAGILTTTAA
jgi:hypothetical protein